MIVLHEVFEHLVDPGNTFRTLRRRCLPGGRICIRSGFLPDSPDAFDSWWYRSDLTHIGFLARETAGFLADSLNMLLEYENGRDTIILKEKPCLPTTFFAGCATP